MKPIEIVTLMLFVFGSGMAAQYLICYYNYKAKSKARYYEGWEEARRLYKPKPRRRNKAGQYAESKKEGTK